MKGAITYNINSDHHREAHQIAEFCYKGKIIGTADRSHLKENNIKYTISFNKDRTRAWHFLTSGDIFFKWEAEHDKENIVPEAVNMTIYDGNTDGEWISQGIYKPIEVKD